MDTQEQPDAPDSGNDTATSPGAALAAGIIVGGIGFLTLMSAAGILPFESLGWKVPRPVVIGLGMLLVFAGIAALQHVWPDIALFRHAGLLAAIGLIAMLGWVAFGAGPRACSGGLSGFGVSMPKAVAEWECRGAFGAATILFFGLILWGCAASWRQNLGERRWITFLEWTGKALAGIVLLPLLIVLVIFALVSVLIKRLRRPAG